MDPRSYPSTASTDSDQPFLSAPLEVEALTRQLVEGDEVAYRLFYNAYFPRLCRYVFVLTGGNDAAMKDALQMTFIRVVKHVRVFADEPTLWSWLTVLARSAAFDESRKRRRYLAFLDRFQRRADREGFVPADRADSDRLDQLLEKSMAQLIPEERELLDAKYFAHRSVREIAARLRLSEKAVESRLTRARKNLREIIQKHPNDDL